MIFTLLCRVGDESNLQKQAAQLQSQLTQQQNKVKENNANVVYAANAETVKTTNNNDMITFTTAPPVIKEAAAGILSALGLAERKRRN